MFFPSTAALIQHKIGASRAWGFDLAGACSGFTFSLATASQLVSTGRHNHALVVGADTMSSIIDYKDRATCVLFGDGAGAVVVSPAKDRGLAIIDFAHEIDGSGGAALNMPAGGSLRPRSAETVAQRLHYVKQDGQAVFKFAVRKTEEIGRADPPAQPHYRRRPRAVRVASGESADHHRRGRPPRDRARSKVIINLERYGNTTAAHHPARARGRAQDGRLKKGDLVLLASVGAGFTVGSVLLRWAI